MARRARAPRVERAQPVGLAERQFEERVPGEEGPLLGRGDAVERDVERVAPRRRDGSAAAASRARVGRGRIVRARREERQQRRGEGRGAGAQKGHERVPRMGGSTGCLVALQTVVRRRVLVK